MRMGIGDIAPKPQGWTPMQMSDCLPYSCGVHDDVAGAACTAFGAYTTYGAPSCLATECQPFRSQIPDCGGAVPQVSVSSPAPVLTKNSPPPPVTVYSIQQPLPDIAGALRPSPVSQCSPWGDLNGMIAAHPVESVAVLLGIAFVLWPKGGRRG